MLELIDIRALLIVFLIFVPIEHLVPEHGGRGYLRKGLLTDLLHFFITGLLFRIGFLVVIGASVAGVNVGVPSAIGEAVRSQPLWLQVVGATIVADVGFYISHRTLHSVPFLWRFHAIHHSIEELDALAAHRVHPLDQLFVKTASLLPVYALGFSTASIVIASTFYLWQALLIHSNVRLNFGPLKWIIASPLFHHWHHAHEPQAFDKNFAGQLSFLDALFGTMYMPERMPTRYGTDEPVPENYAGQLAYPFKSVARQNDVAETPT